MKDQQGWLIRANAGRIVRKQQARGCDDVGSDEYELIIEPAPAASERLVAIRLDLANSNY